MTPLWLAILTNCSSAVLLDLTAWQRARSAWIDDPIGKSKPNFDLPLFACRLAIGAITGLLIGMGINVTAATAAQGAQ